MTRCVQTIDYRAVFRPPLFLDYGLGHWTLSHIASLPDWGLLKQIGKDGFNGGATLFWTLVTSSAYGTLFKLKRGLIIRSLISLLSSHQPDISHHILLQSVVLSLVLILPCFSNNLVFFYEVVFLVQTITKTVHSVAIVLCILLGCLDLVLDSNLTSETCMCESGQSKVVI